jgi:hypothetical protein
MEERYSKEADLTIDEIMTTAHFMRAAHFDPNLFVEKLPPSLLIYLKIRASAKVVLIFTVRVSAPQLRRRRPATRLLFLHCFSVVIVLHRDMGACANETHFLPFVCWRRA